MKRRDSTSAGGCRRRCDGVDLCETIIKQEREREEVEIKKDAMRERVKRTVDVMLRCKSVGGGRTIDIPHALGRCGTPHRLVTYTPHTLQGGPDRVGGDDLGPDKGGVLLNIGSRSSMLQVLFQPLHCQLKHSYRAYQTQSAAPGSIRASFQLFWCILPEEQ